MNQFQGPQNYEVFTIPNPVISTYSMVQNQAPTLSTSASSFTPASKPFVPAKKAAAIVVTQSAQVTTTASVERDPIAAKLQGHRLSDDEISKVKDLLSKVKSEGQLTLELITQFRTLALCQQKPKFFWEEQTKRVPDHRVLEKTSFSKGGGGGGRGGYPQRGGRDNNRGGREGGRGGYNDNRGGAGDKDAFGKGQIKQDRPREEVVPLDPFKRAEADTLRKKLVEESKKVFEKAKSDKNVHQQIRLIVNVITPDNLDKKFEELRKIIFGDLKH